MSTPSVTQAIEVDFTRVRRVGMTIIAVVFGGFGLWAVVAPLDSAALAPGVVIVKSYKKTIQHLEGGIVKDILVHEGDRVEAGDTLLVLDNTQTRAKLEIAKAQLFAFKARESRLLAERDGNDFSADVSAKVSEEPSALVSKELRDPRFEKEIQSQRNFFNARASANQGETEVLNQRVEQLQANVSGLEALKRSKVSLVKSYAEEIQDYRGLLAEGYADKVRLRELERSHSRLEGEVAEHISSIAGTRIQVGETKLQILQLRKEFQSAVIDELGQVQTKLNDVEEQVRALEDTSARNTITSPVSGMAMSIQVHTIGAIITPGSAILDVIPSSGEFLVESQVSPADIDRVITGQKAKIRFSAFNSATPVIEGEVMTLSADRLTNEQTGMPYFLARVEVTAVGKKDLGGLELIPGMPAEVLINTGSRTFFEYLTQPITNALARSLIEE